MNQSHPLRAGALAPSWPQLSFSTGKDTYETLQLWTQVVGKIRRAQMPWANHSWNVTLYVTARGLTTSPIPYRERAFDIDFDFIDHALVIRVSDGQVRTMALGPGTVASFYNQLFAELGAMGIEVKINRMPNEVETAIPFDRDEQHATYDAGEATRFFRALLQSQRVLQEFRSGFIGKCSPVHFFWGAFDLAVTRFSGRKAPEHPGNVTHLPDWVVRDAYSHEVSSCGFWPGGGPIPYAAYYSYAYPEPAGFGSANVVPREAFYSDELREFILPYDVVRRAPAPDALLLEFLQSTYAAAADLGRWDRDALERTM